MRPVVLSLVGAAALTLSPMSAHAWMHAGAYGTASGGDGSWSAHTYAGGSASGGDGSWQAHSAYGGSASGNDGEWHATSADGNTAYGYGAPHYGGTYYAGYHPPTTVDYYGNSCNNCGGWSGGAVAAAGAVGLAAGAAIGATDAAVATSVNNTAAYDAGVAAGSNNAYAAGVAAGEAAAAPGGVYTTLPANCQYRAVGTANDFQCGSMWLQPAYGANGLYYKVITPP